MATISLDCNKIGGGHNNNIAENKLYIAYWR